MELGEAALTSMTTRYYTDDPVSDETLERAFDYARHAPQGGNRQPVRFIVVRDDEKKRQLQEWYLEPWKAYLGLARSGEIEIVGDKAKRLLDSADYFAEHFAEVPAIVVACGYIDGVHPTDTELGRLSIVGGGSIYPAVQNFLLGLPRVRPWHRAHDAAVHVRAAGRRDAEHPRGRGHRRPHRSRLPIHAIPTQARPPAAVGDRLQRDLGRLDLLASVPSAVML